MEITREKISLRQALIMFILSLSAPSLRVVPNYVARTGEQASWVSVIVGLIPNILLVLVIADLFKKFKDKSLYEVYESIFGKVINKLIIIMHILWIGLILSIYLRMFGERYLGTILFDANLHVFLLLMLGFVFFVVNRSIEGFGRMSEILMFFFTFIFLAVFIVSLPEVKTNNLWPVTIYDSWNILKGVVPILSLSCYFTAVMFLGDKITYKEQLKRFGVNTMLFLGFVALIIIVSTIGLFGYKINAQFLFPYFATLKNIHLLETIERVESLFISTWLASDFTILTFFSFILLTIIKKFTGAKDYKNFSPIVLLIIFFTAVNIASNVYEIENFARQYLGIGNIILFFFVPIFAWTVGKVRKKI